jgi:transposase
MQDQIRLLYEKGYKVRAIARSLRLSRKTVRKQLGIGARPMVGGSEATDWRRQIDWALVHREVSGKGVTIQQLHREFIPQVPYVTFWRAYRSYQPVQPEVTMRLLHQPGEKAQVDFADGITIIDMPTGKSITTQLFCGVMAFSSYTFGEFVLDQKLATFLSVQERMWHFFGGVTPYTVVDNLKSGVTKAHLYDPDVNPTYCDFANHYGFAVLPARPYHPRDKAAGESNIGAIQRGFYQEVRNCKFYSLRELNDAFREYLLRLNQRVMKDHGVSRWDRFQAEVKLLKPLPATSFEITEWKSAKVHPDCHVQFDRNFYSVPYRHIGYVVRIRFTQKMLEIFSEDGEALAVHARFKGQGRYATSEAHYPEAKLAAARFDLHQAQSQGKGIGVSTEKLISHLLNREHPLKYLRRIQGILRLYKTQQVSAGAMEYACAQAMSFNKLRVAYIRECAIYYDHHGLTPSLVSPVRVAGTYHLHEGDLS